jgi:hypothetical protein
VRYRTAKRIPLEYREADMPRKSPRIKAYSTRVDDYPAMMSGFERESLAAEAKLKVEREKKKPSKLRNTKKAGTEP